MDELKKAYELFSLPEGAAREEVEKRYFMFIRRERAIRLRHRSERTDELPIHSEEIHKAYKTILEDDGQMRMKPFDSAEYGKYNRHYMFPVIGAFFCAIVMMCVMLYGIQDYMDHRHKTAELAKLPPVDLSVTFYGEYVSRAGTDTNKEFHMQSPERPEGDVFEEKSPRVSDSKPLEADILSTFPQWTSIKAFVAYAPSDIKLGLDELLPQGSMGDLLNNHPSDIYIMDQASFTKLAGYYALLPLEGANADKLGSSLHPKLKLKAMTEDGLEEHVYGIDISASPLLKGLPIAGKTYIAGIGSESEQPDHAFAFIKKYLDGDTSKK
ncbi:hypothetical protein GZH47_26335 [Paenibacillus rhizovicinus]|uniref:J domain-containing protein n=1 Tax=Paenibacillus rhizovicinus TaxID=2704463 RepID=A0A6C0P6K0_9BACL|nr:hypothetical protein [Paenibacillus rhizovicinus]QHW33966.1 hypothetical protein GZH47_26335 [Paenibacillus rhizovicinus]